MGIPAFLQKSYKVRAATLAASIRWPIMEPELSTNTQTTASVFFPGNVRLYTAPPGSAMARISSFFPRYIRRSVRSFWFSRIGRSLVRSLFSTFLAEASYADSQLFSVSVKVFLYRTSFFTMSWAASNSIPSSSSCRRVWASIPMS